MSLRAAGLILVLFFSIVWSQSHFEESDDQVRKEQVLSMYQSYKNRSFSDVQDITTEEYLEVSKKEEAVLVDVRTKKEMQISMIPGAITLTEFEKNKDNYKDKEVNIVIYCTIGYRSGLYTEELLKENLNAYNLIGGVLGWAHAGQTFISSNGDSLRVHVYGDDWDLLPEGYESVW